MRTDAYVRGWESAASAATMKIQSDLEQLVSEAKQEFDRQTAVGQGLNTKVETTAAALASEVDQRF